MGATGQINTGVFRLFLNGRDPERWVDRTIQRIVVEDELNMPAMFSIEMALMVLIQKSSSRSEDLLFFDDAMFNLFTPGTEVEIHMGMDSPEKIFSGKAAALSPRFDSLSTLEITGFDPLYKLMFGKKSRSFKEMKDSDIVSEIAGDASLQAKATVTETKYPYIFQNNRSDYDFLLERARRIGYEIAAQDGALLFRKPADTDQPEVSLKFGSDLVHFSPSMRTLIDGSETEFRGWDYRNKTGLSGRATLGDETVKAKTGSGTPQKSAFQISTAFAASPARVVDASVLDDGEAEKLAKARFNETVQKFITGEGQAPGNPAIRAGKTVEITGVGPKFSGVYYVTSSRHLWEEGEYTTSFRVRRTLL